MRRFKGALKVPGLFAHPINALSDLAASAVVDLREMPTRCQFGLPQTTRFTAGREQKKNITLGKYNLGTYKEHP